MAKETICLGGVVVVDDDVLVAVIFFGLLHHHVDAVVEPIKSKSKI